MRPQAGYLIGAGAMIAGGLVAPTFAVKAEGKSLEDVARPLSVIARSAQAVLHPENKSTHLCCPGLRIRP